MKILITTIFICFYSLLFAQDPPVLNIDNLEYNWSVTIADSNFVKEAFDPFSSKYWGYSFLQLYEYQDNILLLNGSRTQSPYGGTDGCLIHNIEKETGDVNWIHHNNINSGNDRRSSYHISSMSINENDQLHLVGLTDLDSIRFDVGISSFRAQPSISTIDLDSGMRINSSQGTEDLSSYFNFSFFVFMHTNKNGEVFGITPLQKRENGVNFSTFEIIGLDANNNFQLPFITDARVALTDDSEELPRPISVFNIVDQDKLLFFYYDPNIDDLAFSPFGVYIQVVDVSSLDDVFVSSEFYVDENIYYPQTNINGTTIFPRVVDNTLLLSQSTFLDGDPNKDLFIWMQWHDLDGNILATVPMAKGNGENFDVLTPIGKVDDKMYFVGSRDDEFSICYLRENEEDVTEVKTFKVSNPEFREVVISNMEFLENEKVFMRIKCTYLNDEGRASDYSYMTLFDNEEIGITTSTDKLEQEILSNWLYPNPASDIIQIGLDFDGEVYINDVNGRLVHSQSLRRKEEINISHLSSGIYIVSFIDSRNFYRETLVIQNE